MFNFLKKAFGMWLHLNRMMTLQRKIATTTMLPTNMDKYLKEVLSGENMPDKTEALFKEFIEACLNNKHNAEIVKQYGSDTKDLETIFWSLKAAGFGLWTRGYYVALSGFMYPETLIFLFETRKRGLNILDSGEKLFSYFDRKQMNGSLFATLDADDAKRASVAK